MGLNKGSLSLYLSISLSLCLSLSLCVCVCLDYLLGIPRRYPLYSVCVYVSLFTSMRRCCVAPFTSASRIVITCREAKEGSGGTGWETGCLVRSFLSGPARGTGPAGVRVGAAIQAVVQYGRRRRRTKISETPNWSDVLFTKRKR
ncbi:hypothetical protein LZ31DRAFT_137957 [Colletotrichum somersetense]|nr:hypothetical protein LZ31DRAFT_137957 [Colletotrichum somersetense]